MQKLIITYKDDSILTVTQKGKYANVMREWETKYAKLSNRFKKVVFQQYPINRNKPVFLIGGEG